MNEEIRNSNPIATCAAILALAIMTFLIGRSCVDGICLEVDRQRQHEPAPAYARPAAYRLQSPTTDQMEAYHHLMQIQEVRR